MSNKPKIRPSKSTADRQEQLCQDLAEAIAAAVQAFATVHPNEITFPVALGAINIFRTNIYLNQPNRRMAQLSREADDKIVKHLLDITPDHFFGNRPTDTNLN